MAARASLHLSTFRRRRSQPETAAAPSVHDAARPANAARGTYYAWESITRRNGDYAEISLLLNRPAPWLDIESHLPYEGNARIHNKAARRINVRIPAWIDHKALTCTLNGRPCPAPIVANRLLFINLDPGHMIELLFPVKTWRIERTASAWTEAETIHLIDFRGNTAVDISPRDVSPTV